MKRKTPWTPKLDRVTGLGREDLGLDEIVASECWFHFERMANDAVWFVVYTRQGQRISVHLTSRSPIKAVVEREKTSI